MKTTESRTVNNKHGISDHDTPTRKSDFPAWYHYVIAVAELADHGFAKGSIVIRPHAYRIWEHIRNKLDKVFRTEKIQNAYFPLLFPSSLLEKEAELIGGASREVAVVTHIYKEGDGKIEPVHKLGEPLVIRPTSEIIIGHSLAKWVQSYRDLPYKVNQWSNVVRWEKHSRMLLRNTEFLWQEGHTVHESKESAVKQALAMLDHYHHFLEVQMGIPGIKGEKSDHERFPGALNSWTYESMMQDGKSLQMSTCHYLGQSFAKMSNIRYLDKEDKQVYGHTTSFGLSTRILGAMVMVHGDDIGALIPPRVAAKHVVIIPIVNRSDERDGILSYCAALAHDLNSVDYMGMPVEVFVNKKDNKTFGALDWEAMKYGTPIRVHVGQKDIDSDRLPFYLRTYGNEKKEEKLSRNDLIFKIGSLLDRVHSVMHERATLFLKNQTVEVPNVEYFKHIFVEGLFPYKFARCWFCMDRDKEKEIQGKYGVTLRCIPFEQGKTRKRCLFTNADDSRVKEVIFAKAY